MSGLFAPCPLPSLRLHNHPSPTPHRRGPATALLCNLLSHPAAHPLHVHQPLPGYLHHLHHLPQRRHHVPGALQPADGEHETQGHAVRGASLQGWVLTAWSAGEGDAGRPCCFWAWEGSAGKRSMACCGEPGLNTSSRCHGVKPGSGRGRFSDTDAEWALQMITQRLGEPPHYCPAPDWRASQWRLGLCSRLPSCLYV